MIGAIGANRREVRRARVAVALLCLLLLPAPLEGQSEVDPRTSAATLGPVSVSVTLEPSAPRIGDTLVLSIEAVAEPEVEVLMPAFGEALGRFVIIDFTPRERLDAVGRTVHSQRYSLDVPMSGEWSIPPLVVEFVDRRAGQRSAPEGDDAYELLTEPIEFTVASVLPTEAASDLAPPLGELPPLATAAERARPWLISGALLLFLVPLVLYLIFRVGRRGLRRSAYEIAIARLRTLQRSARTTPEEIDRFYVELSGIVRRYLEDRFEIRAPESTTEEFLDRASRSHALSREHQDLLVDFLRQADLVKFAGTIPGEREIEASLANAARFLEETREDAPLVEVGTAPAGGGER